MKRHVSQMRRSLQRPVGELQEEDLRHLIDAKEAAERARIRVQERTARAGEDLRRVIQQREEARRQAEADQDQEDEVLDIRPEGYQMDLDLSETVEEAYAAALAAQPVPEARAQATPPRGGGQGGQPRQQRQSRDETPARRSGVLGQAGTPVTPRSAEYAGLSRTQKRRVRRQALQEAWGADFIPRPRPSRENRVARQLQLGQQGEGPAAAGPSSAPSGDRGRGRGFTPRQSSRRPAPRPARYRD